jgi:Spy/CpxP family protein refolding chaperone
MLTPEQRQKMRAWHRAHRGEKSNEQAPPSA